MAKLHHSRRQGGRRALDEAVAPVQVVPGDQADKVEALKLRSIYLELLGDRSMYLYMLEDLKPWSMDLEAEEMN